MNNLAQPSSRMMKAIVLDEPGSASTLNLRELPIPEPRSGWVLLRVMAFGLNRSELHTRLGLAGPDVTFPRVLGIEATGIIEAAPGTDLPIGSKAVAMMGGMGRSFDGGYAEYTLVPEANIVLVETELDWTRLGALPEVLQTAYGSMTVGMGVNEGDTILIRGGTSSVGLVTAMLGKQRNMRVLATTRKANRAKELLASGVDDVIIDDGEIADKVNELVPGGVDGALELVGAPTLQDALACTRVGGTVCFTGMLSNKWIIEEFYPIAFIPTGVRLTAYGGEANDLPSDILSSVADAMHRGELSLPIVTYEMNQIEQAHDDMEHNKVVGKQVVLTSR